MSAVTVEASGQSSIPPLRYYEMDWEQRLGFTSIGGMSSNLWLSGLAALVLTVLVYVIAFFVPPNFFSKMLIDRGPTQHAAVFFGFWCMFILLVKQSKLKRRRSRTLLGLQPNLDRHFEA